MKQVYLVTGAPGSGKSTYVKENAGKNDLVFDLDSINEALGGTMHGKNLAVLPVSLAMRQAAIEAIAGREGDWDNAYFISASSDRKAIESLCKQLEAEEIKIDATPEQCWERINADDTRTNKAEQINLVNKWYGMETESTPKTAQEEFTDWLGKTYGF